MNTTNRVFGVFAKYWQPGFVKTRLARRIGQQAAANLHLAFVKTLLRRFESLHALRQLCFEPPDRLSEFRSIAGSCWQLSPQNQGDLGDRLQQFFSNSFQTGAGCVVAIGSDSPNLPAEMVTQAMQSLDEADVVIGPSLDGGYYLLGLSRKIEGLFEDIPWSTEHVRQRTVERLTANHVPFVQLAPWYDVDDYKDLERLWSDLRDCRGAEFNELFQAVCEVLESQTE